MIPFLHLYYQIYILLFYFTMICFHEDKIIETTMSIEWFATLVYMYVWGLWSFKNVCGMEGGFWLQKERRQPKAQKQRRQPISKQNIFFIKTCPTDYSWITVYLLYLGLFMFHRKFKKMLSSQYTENNSTPIRLVCRLFIHKILPRNKMSVIMVV